MSRKKTPEGYVLEAVMDYLAAKRIFALRMNSGAIRLESQGRTRYFKGHDPGTSDVLAFPPGQPTTWIEVKSEKGRQSELQKIFEHRVLSEGHRYVLAYSVDDVASAIGDKCYL